MTKEPSSIGLFSQLKRSADYMTKHGYKVAAKYDPLGDMDFYIVDAAGRIVK